MEFRFASFVFDRNDAAVLMKLYYIGLSVDGVNNRSQGESPCDSDAALGFTRAACRPISSLIRETRSMRRGVMVYGAR